ncbi:carbohydrate ABC transporter substrate-binding protein, CUT1 family (TC 3.A.1.1.-) [Devosia enhydra]|uniref:Carbohydrate ABC transporter substrate-binding protein, CUT1 family (TC 3.A.1.1.-) n=1 Tax=Devosia enhydra TaxID=665118 RepID=A0A1K2I3K7_9HYPH|nr:ABC transporter substrate-binding protein [Devosia enhydra]SFZ86815.1 carbohydrate ABC transporter substrate-binding protein, CUT1 family (TC 3.A.1.1.-) [Devosia enhydra]
MKTRVSIIFGLAAVLGSSVSAGAVDLRMSWWGGDARHAATQEAIKFCGDKHGHTVAAEYGGFGGHQEKVTTQLAGGTEPDIMQINWPWLPLMSKDGSGFADLATLGELDTSNWTAADLAAGTTNGKLNGLSVSTTGRVFFMNATAFEKAGLAIPTTWDELIAATPKFKEVHGQNAYPFYAAGLDALLIVSLVTTQMTGKDLIDPATNTVAWTPAELAKGIAFYQSLVDTGTIQSWQDAAGSGNTNLQERADWIEGRIGGAYQWDSTYSQYAGPLTKGQTLVSVPILKVSDALTDGVYRKPSMVWSISARTPNAAAAATILNCLVNDEGAIAIMAGHRGLPANAAAAEQLLASGGIDENVVAANRLVMEAEGPTVSPYNEHPEIRDIFQSTLEEFAYGLLSADEAGETIIDSINGVLARI